MDSVHYFANDEFDDVDLEKCRPGKKISVIQNAFCAKDSSDGDFRCKTTPENDCIKSRSISIENCGDVYPTNILINDITNEIGSSLDNSDNNVILVNVCKANCDDDVVLNFFNFDLKPKMFESRTISSCHSSFDSADEFLTMKIDEYRSKMDGSKMAESSRMKNDDNNRKVSLGNGSKSIVLEKSAPTKETESTDEDSSENDIGREMRSPTIISRPVFEKLKAAANVASSTGHRKVGTLYVNICFSFD